MVTVFGLVRLHAWLCVAPIDLPVESIHCDTYFFTVLGACAVGEVQAVQY